MHLQKKYRLAILLALLAFSIFNFFNPVILFEIPNRNNKTATYSIETLVKRAEAGDAEAQFQLALRYQNGRNVEKDNRKAFELYQKAANQGHAKAQNNLGVSYEQGDTVTIDLDKALSLYKSAAAQDLLIAKENLANLYMIKKDFQNAQQILHELAAKNNADANKKLGYLYLTGSGVAADPSLAKEYFEKAASQNDAYAQYHLGEIYRKEGNFERAHYWINQAVEKNYPAAYGSSGLMYKNGSGVEKNPLKAGKFYKKAADLNEEGMDNHLQEIENYCIQPYAPTPDHVEACLVSAGAGSPDARKLLAAYYYFGQGVEKDHIEALAWGLLTPADIPKDKRDPITIRSYAVMANLFLTLDKESVEKAKQKAIEYKKEYAGPTE